MMSLRQQTRNLPHQLQKQRKTKKGARHKPQFIYNLQYIYLSIFTFLLKYVLAIGVGFHWTWITFLLFQCNFEKRHPFYYFSDCLKLSCILINCSVNLIFSFLIRWISSSWAIFIWRWFLSSSSKDFWICCRLSRCRAAASRFLLRLRFRCSS